MELRLDSRSTQDAIAQAAELLEHRRLVLVFGDRLTLSALAIAEPIQPSLVGAATMEDEGVELVLRAQPDLLICSSDLETGYGPVLLRRVKAELPTCQLLIVLEREALDAFADGVIFKSSLGTGRGDLIADTAVEESASRLAPAPPRPGGIQRKHHLVAAVSDLFKPVVGHAPLEQPLPGHLEHIPLALAVLRFAVGTQQQHATSSCALRQSGRATWRSATRWEAGAARCDTPPDQSGRPSVRR